MNILNKILNWGLVGLIFLLPLFFLPITTDFYDFNKNLFLLVAGGLLLVIWGLKMVFEGRVKFIRTPFDLPVLLFATSYLLSVIFASPNKVEAAILPGGLGTILGLTLLYFLITNNLKEAGIDRLLYGLIASAGLLSLIAVYQFIGVGEAFVPAQAGLDWLRSKSWTPAGGPLVLATFLVAILPLAIAKSTRIKQILTDQTDRESAMSVLLSVVSVFLILAGLGVTVYQLFTTAKPILLPQIAGWVIALEAFKRTPLFGVGPENFVSAFTTGKPIGFNLSQFWALRFGVSSNYFFHLLTTVGILGFGAWLFLIWRTIQVASTQIKQMDNRLNRSVLSVFLSVISVFLMVALLPASFLLLTTFYLLLALLGVGLAMSEYKEESKILANIICFIILVIVVASLYGIGRVFAAEVFFKKSLDAAAANRGTDTYNLQIKTVQNNPYSVTYRIAYSQTNLALANAIASNPPAGGLTDQDRQNISQLIQQSIREAKAAVALGQNRAENWENLAIIYRQLLNFAQGADQWTVAAYNQAIVLDPLNPILRLNLGGVYYASGNYDEAIRQFTIATNLKPDFANGHYNLSAAYREKGNIAQAVREMEQTLALVGVDSNDYQKANQELTDLRAKLPKEEKPAVSPISPPTGGPETLAPPATPPAGIKPPLTLPKEVEPPSEGTPSGR